MRTDDDTRMVRSSVLRFGSVIGDISPSVPLTFKQVSRIRTHQHERDGEHITGKVSGGIPVWIVRKIGDGTDYIHRQSTFLRLYLHMRRVIELQRPLDDLVLLSTFIVTLLGRVEHALDSLCQLS